MEHEPTSILAFRNGSIGNTLVAVPALRALRVTFPRARLAVVVDPLGFQLLEHCPWINRLIVYDKRGADRGVIAYLRLVHTLRSLRPSHVILFKRFFRNGLLGFLSGAQVRVGYRTDNSAPFLNRTIPFDETVNSIDANLDLAALIGAQSVGRHLEMFLSDDDQHAAAAIMAQHAVASQSFIAAHYGGLSWEPDFISRERYTELLKRIAGSHAICFVGAGDREAAWAAEMAAKLHSASVVCNLPVRLTAALLKHARLFVGFNSGPTHLAAAVGTPSLMLFKPDHSDALQVGRWLPPGGLTLPLLPPKNDRPEMWEAFFSHAEQTAASLQTQSPSNV
jgi:ADP-heptose:LPS heptosyltransferase